MSVDTQGLNRALDEAESLIRSAVEATGWRDDRVMMNLEFGDVERVLVEFFGRVPESCSSVPKDLLQQAIPLARTLFGDSYAYESVRDKCQELHEIAE